MGGVDGASGAPELEGGVAAAPAPDAGPEGGAPVAPVADAGPAFLLAGFSMIDESGRTDIEAALHLGSSWYIGGSFTRISPRKAPNLIALQTAAGPTRGAPVPCSLETNGVVAAMAATPSAIYVGGMFSRIQGASMDNLAKLDPVTCAVDTAFDGNVGSPDEDAVLAIAVRGGSPDAYEGEAWISALAIAGGDLYVGGSFTAYAGIYAAANRIAKLDLATGAIDTTFSPPGPASNGFDGAVRAIVADGPDIFVGGSFTQHKGVPASAYRVAKLDRTTGAIDRTFNPPVENGNGFTREGTGGGWPAGVYSLAVDSTHVYAGGDFTAYRGVPGSANRIAKLDRATGAIDTTFSRRSTTTRRPRRRSTPSRGSRSTGSSTSRHGP